MADELVLWGRRTSANVQKPMWALAELGVPHEQREVGGKYGGLDSPEFVAMNPNKVVPVLQHGDLVLWESNAIVRYIAATWGSGSLWPVEPRKRAVADQWTDWTATTIQPAWTAVFVRLVRTAPSKRDPQAITAAVAAANALFAILDEALARTPYLAGNQLTYADIIAGVSLYRWYDMDIQRRALPHVEAWHARLRERTAFRNTVEVSYADLAAHDPA
jgi:glutathione S-transferase